MSTFDEEFPPGSPVAAASRWLELVLRDKDLNAAWPLTDPEFRRIAVGSWFDANGSHPALRGEDRKELVEALSKDQPNHWLWAGFAATQLDEFATAWSNVDLDTWGWGNWPRPYAPDFEIAALFESDGTPWVAERDMMIRGLQLVMHHMPASSWLVAGMIDPESGELAPKRNS